MRTAVTAVAVAVCGLAAACDGSGSSGATCPDGGSCRQVETTVLINPPSRAKLDIVLVVDQAALVDGRAQHLRSALGRLAAYIHFPFDTQVALLAARPGPMSSPDGPSLWPAPSGSCGLHPGESFLRDATTCGTSPNFDGKFEEQLACAIPDGTAAPAAGPGRPIEALIALLGAARSPALAGLIRPDAHLAIGIFTAGDDAEAAGPVAEVLRAGLIRLKGDNPARVNVQVFVALPEGQPCLDPGGPAHAPALAAFVQRFAIGGLSTSCDSDWPARFEQVVPGRIMPLFVYCLPDSLVDRDPAAAGVQPECVLQETRPAASGQAPQSEVLPACSGAAGDAACWTSVPDVTCNTGLRVEVQRTCGPPGGTIQRLTCATSP
jgi:hypothetical protein